MSALAADLGPRVPADWTVVVPAPGSGWVRSNEPRNARAAYAWRLAADRAVRDAGLPPLRVDKIRAELRLPRDAGPGRVDLGPYLRTAQMCVQGLRDAVGCGACMPTLLPGAALASSPGGEVVLHITGEVRS